MGAIEFNDCSCSGGRGNFEAENLWLNFDRSAWLDVMVLDEDPPKVGAQREGRSILTGTWLDFSDSGRLQGLDFVWPLLSSLGELWFLRAKTSLFVPCR